MVQFSPAHFRCIILCVFFLSSNLLAQKKIFVSTDGDDAAPGTSQKPVKSLQKALDLAKSYSQDSVRIIVGSGDYYLSQPILLDKSFARTEKNRIVIMGNESNPPTFYGGQKLKARLDKKSGYWIISRNGSKSFTQMLSRNGKQKLISSLPSQGYFKIINPERTETFISTKAEKEIAKKIESFSPAEMANIYGVFNIQWSNIIRLLSHYDAKNRRLQFNGPNFGPWYSLKDKQTEYRLINVPVLDEGRWYNADHQTVIYRPEKGETIENSTFIVPEVDKLIEFTGDTSTKISNITLSNICIEQFGKALGRQGFEPSQSAVSVDAVLTLENASKISLKNLKVQNIQTHAVWIKDNCDYISISNNNFNSLAAGAIKVGNEQAPPKNMASSNILITDNVIKNGGLFYTCAAAVNLLNARDCKVLHNDISDFFYTGISVGWVWGYGESVTKNNEIAYNHIYHLGKGVLDDLAGVYTLGISDGTVIHHNIVHDINSKEYGGWGFYTDEGSSNIRIINNLAYNCSDAGFHQHYGRNNLIENNIFAWNGKAAVEASRVEDHNSFNFNNNILVMRNNDFTGRNWQHIKKKMKGNVYFSSQIKSLEGSRFSSGDANSVIMDPKLRADGFVLQPANTEIFSATDFKPIDFRNVGTRK